MWEIAIKVSIGKLTLSQPLHQLVDDLRGGGPIRLLPIVDEDVLAIASLPFHHRDPFDRLLIAQAIVKNLTILGQDSVFDGYSIRRIW